MDKLACREYGDTSLQRTRGITPMGQVETWGLMPRQPEQAWGFPHVLVLSGVEEREERALG